MDLASQVYEMHGLHGVDKLSTGKRPYSECQEEDEDRYSFEPESTRYVKGVVDNMDNTLKTHFVEMLKKRDKYIHVQMTHRERKEVDNWLKKTVTVDDDDDVCRTRRRLDRYIETKIIYPTETSLNTLNMITNASYVHSSYSDRRETDPEIGWSGMNIEYIQEKNKLNLEQSLLILAIVDVYGDNNDCLKQYDDDEVVDVIENETLQTYSERLFDDYAERLHDRVVKNINLSELTNLINRSIDYMSALHFVPKGDQQQQSSTYGGMSILSNDRNGYIPDLNEFIVVQLPGNELVGYDFKQKAPLTIHHRHPSSYIQSSSSPLEKILSDELRLNEMIHQFVLSLTHKPFIITEARPPPKKGEIVAKKGDDDDGEPDNQYEIKAREQEIKMATLEEKRRLRNEASERARELHEMKRQQFIMDHEMKVKAKNAEMVNKNMERRQRLQDRIEKSLSEKEKIEAKMAEQTTKELQRLIEQKYSCDKLDWKHRHELLETATKGMGKSQNALARLLTKLTKVADRSGSLYAGSSSGSDAGVVPSILFTRLC